MLRDPLDILSWTDTMPRPRGAPVRVGADDIGEHLPRLVERLRQASLDLADLSALVSAWSGVVLRASHASPQAVRDSIRYAIPLAEIAKVAGSLLVLSSELFWCEPDAARNKETK